MGRTGAGRRTHAERGRKTSASCQFTSWWTDAANRKIRQRWAEEPGAVSDRTLAAVPGCAAIDPRETQSARAPRHGMAAETVFTSLNGLKSNSEAQVLDANGDPVPNLWCAGNCQGSRFAFDYPVTYMGVSHGLALTYGYIAGMNAAANKRVGAVDVADLDERLDDLAEGVAAVLVDQRAEKR